MTWPVICLFVAVTADSYTGYHVIDVVPQDEKQIEFLQNLLRNDINVDFWEKPVRVGRKVRLMMSGDYVNNFISNQIAYNHLQYSVYSNNVQVTVDQEQSEIEARRLARGYPFDINDFNTLNDINGWLADQNKNCPAELTCDFYSLGSSYEGKDINIFTVTASPGTPVIYLDSTHHAREWITPATNLKIINHLMTGYGTNPEVTGLLDTRTWHFVVVVNPDGYEFSWESDRYQRKNRAPNANSTCVGTDLNRNYNYKWGENGMSFDPCAHNYCGSSPGSELETQAVSEHLNAVSSQQWAMVTLHSYGFQLVHPWGTTTQAGNDSAPCDIAADHDDMFAVVNAFGTALETTGGFEWEWGNSCVVIGTTSGATDDYAKGAAGWKYSYNPELRGQDFVIGAEHIEPSFQELWAGLVAMDAAIAANPPIQA